MALTLIQAGASLQFMNDSGVLSNPLTLPSGITLRTDVAPRFTVYGNYAILVNTASQPLTIDAAGNVRVLSPKAPRLAAVLAGTGSSTLTGAYQAQYTFVTLDGSGNLLSESDFSPVSNQATITNQFLQASNLDLSADAISGRRIYRTTSNGATFFQWVDLDGNILTSIQDNLADAGLSLVAAPILGTPPELTLIAEFRDRLFGVGRIEIDELRYTEVGLKYAWPADNVFVVPGGGTDNIGVTALIPRRDALGIGKQNGLYQLSGTDDTDFQIIVLSRNLGVSSQESVAVYRDVAYFLWEDGVYQWDSNGVVCISDGVVRSWFASDTTFNRSLFSKSFGHVDPIRNKYRLFLYAAGSSTEVLWIEYDLMEKTWWGPHKTDAFNPSCVFTVLDDGQVPRPTIGGTDNNLYREQDLCTDGTSTPITLDVITKRYCIDEPDLDKFWGELSVIGKSQSSGTLTINLDVGELDATLTSTELWNMTQSRQRLRRVGVGKHVEMEFTNAEVGQDVQLYAIEINPVTVLGRR